ncbi:MAG: hypothetical protein WBW74_09970 [Xanthobacteraceae bacterium]
MAIRAYAAVLCVAVIAVAAMAASPAGAQTQTQTKKKYVYTNGRATSGGRPRARVTVAPRSFLDAGTEVLPGERKFTDYAYPPAYFPLGVVTNTGGRVGWHNSPLPGPFDLPSRNNPFGW